MFCLSMILTVLGVTQSALNVLGTEVNIKVRPGQNVTLNCDLAWDVGYHINWIRNCSHYKQPPFIMSSELMMKAVERGIFRYAFQWNPLTKSNDFVIANITESDLGLYYCSASKTKVVDEDVIDAIQTHRFSNITYKLSFEDVAPSPPPSCSPPDGVGGVDLHWMLLVILCSLCAVLSAIISFTCAFCLCSASLESGAYLNKRDCLIETQDEYSKQPCATIDILKKRHPNLEFSTYTEIAYELLP